MADEVFQVVPRLRVGAETCGELRQQWAELASLRQRVQASQEEVEILLGHRGVAPSALFEHLGVGELLPQLGGETEVRGDALCPVRGGRGRWWAIERAVALARVEVLSVE